jgi:hypothetical protein
VDGARTDSGRSRSLGTWNSGGERVDLIIVDERARETSRRDRRDREASAGRIALSSSAASSRCGLGRRWAGNGNGGAIGD